jgi:predicted permease
MRASRSADEEFQIDFEGGGPEPRSKSGLHSSGDTFDGARNRRDDDRVYDRRFGFTSPASFQGPRTTRLDLGNAHGSGSSLLLDPELSRYAGTVQNDYGFRRVGAARRECDGFGRSRTASRRASDFQCVPVVGIDAAAGRALDSGDGEAGSNRVVVITHGLWQRRFGGDAGIIGQPINLNGEAHTIIGVLPRYFTFPVAPEGEFAVPLILETDARRADRGSRFLRGFGRLAPNVTIPQAQAELASITERLKTEHPDENGKFMPPRVVPLHMEIIGSYETVLWTLQCAVAVVLLIACSNLASMLLARSSARRRELAIRTAIGASRPHLLAQLFVESFFIGLSGGAAGLLLAWLGLASVVAVGPADLPRAVEVSLDIGVVGFAFVLSILAAGLFGIAPMRFVHRFDLIDELKGGRGTSGAPREIRTRRALVTCEVTMAVVLLIVAGLLMRSFTELQGTDSGVEAERVLLARLSMQAGDRLRQYSEKLLAEVRQMTGVESAVLASVVPLSGMNSRTDFTIAGRPPSRPTDIPGAQHRWVSPGYFRTMSIPIVRGRDFTEFDRQASRGVAIVDETTAQQFFPASDPIGQHIRITDGPQAREAEIIGIVGSVKHFTLDEPPTPTLYGSLDQIHPVALGFFVSSFNLVVRTKGDPAGYADRLREVARSVDKDVPASGIRTMREFLSAAVSPRRFNVRLIQAFAGAALVLAALGLYAVVAYLVTQRHSEMGIRMALGAGRRTVISMVIADGMKLVAAGVVLGLGVAVVVARSTSGMLFGVSPLDPATFIVVPVTMLLVSFAAAYMAARPAGNVDPRQLL